MDQNAVQLNYDLVPSPQVASKLQRQMQDLERNLRFKGPFGPATREVRDFGSELDRANQRVITLGASFAVLATGIKTLKDIVRSTIEVEKAFTEINAVFGLSAKGLDTFSKQLFSTARDTAQSFDKAANAAKEFSRQGLTAEETIKRTRDALILTRLANLDVAKSVETLTASINGFQKSALTSTEIVNKLATVDAKFAVSSADLAEALARSGAAASDAGVSFDQLIGIVTAAQQTTARGGAVIGNALKTIFTRIERRDTVEAFRSLGVEIEDSSGQILGAIPLLQNFAKTYDGLNSSLKKQAAEMVGGVYQINILKALLGDVAKVNGAFAQATSTSAHATDEATKRNEALNQSLDSMLNKLSVTAKQIGSNIGGQSFAGPLKTILSGLQNNPLTAWLEDASGKAETAGGQFAQNFLQGVGGALVYGLGPLLAAALGKVVLSTSKNVFRDFGDLTNLTTQGQAQARVQSEIVGLYRAGGAALQQQLASMSSLTEKAALLQRLLASTSVNPNSPGNMASAMVGQGYRGRGFPRAASGYVPMAEEAAMISRGVGGAPAGAKPVFLPSFNRGGGQRGIVANTSERIVNMAGGSAIFNEAMIQKIGLPPGSTPVAAGGFIPAAAKGSNPYNLPPEYSGKDYYQWKPEAIMQQEQVAAAKAAAEAAARVANQQRAEAFALAQKEMERRETLEEKAATRKAKELALMEGMLDRQQALDARRLTLTKADERNADKALAAVREEQEIAKLEQRRKWEAQRAPIITGRRSVHEIRPIPREPYVVTNEGILNAGGGPPVGPPGGPTSLYGGSRRDAERAQRVYRQQMVEEKQSRRQQEIIAQNERMGRLRERLREATILPPAPAGPPPPTPSFWQRQRARLSPQNLGFAAAFGLPFAGGMIDEGRGGTASGMTRGALGSGLTMAGMGASAGMMFGPMGAAVGGGAGLLLGGAYGALRKMEQSFEELAQEINEAHAKIQRQVEFVQSAFRLQGDVVNILRDKSLSEPQREAKLADRRRGRTQAILSIQDEGIRKQVMARINDPNGQSDITDLLMADQRKGAMATDLRSATRRNLDKGGWFSGYTRENSNDLAKFILPALEQMPDAQRRLTGRLTVSDPSQAFSNTLQSAGVSDEHIAALFKGTGTKAAELFAEAMTKAFSQLAGSDILKVKEHWKDADKAAAKFADSLDTLSQKLREQTQLIQLRAQAEETIERNRQQLGFAPQRMTPWEQLANAGPQSVFALQQQFSAQRAGTLALGQAGLFDQIVAKPGGDSQAFRERVSGLDSLSALEAFREEIGTTAGKQRFSGIATEGFQKELNDLIRTMRVLQVAEEEQIRSTKVVTEANLKAFEFFGTRGGAGLEYGTLARGAQSALARSRRRNDPIDVQMGLTDAASDALNRRDFQSGRITQQQYLGRQAGRSLFRERGQRELDAQGIEELLTSGRANLLTGDQVRSGLMGRAQNKGMSGDSAGSFLGGFRAVMEGAKRDFADFSRIGAQTAEVLTQSATDYWHAWTTGAQKGKDAFKGFVASVASDASRMLASKAFAGLLSAIPGFSGFGQASGGRVGYATGGRAGFAAGGMVPAMLTGGEFVFGPKAAKQVGYDTLRRLNGYNRGGEVQHLASGGVAGMAGMVRGGSGVKDDVPANLPSGSFVVRKSAVQKLGPGYLKALAAGQVQHRFLGGLLNTWMGGALAGGVLGGGLGYLAGGKRGAIGGALLGAIGGGLYGAQSGRAPAGWRDVGGIQADAGPTLSMGSKAALGMGAAAGLGLLAGGIMEPKKEPGPISLSQVPAYMRQLESKQFADRKPGQHAFLQINPQGGYSLAGFDMAPATRRWNDGGGVDAPLAAMPSFSGGGGGGGVSQQVSVRIEINNQGGVSATSSAEGGGVSPESAGRLEKMVRGWARDELVQSYRSDGFSTQRSRYVNNA